MFVARTVNLNEEWKAERANLQKQDTNEGGKKAKRGIGEEK